MAKVAGDATRLTWDGGSPLISNASAHSADPQAFVEFIDLVTDGARRIRKRPGKGAAVGTSAGANIAGLHEFERVDPVTGSVTYYVFRAFGTTLQRWTGAAWSGESLPSGYSISANNQPFFCNFANRCFYVNGIDAMLVFDGASWRVAGIDEPTAAATYSLSSGYSTGTVSATQGSTQITGAGGASWTTGGAWNDLYIDINGVRYQINTVDTATAIILKEGFKEATAGGMTYRIYTGLQSWDDVPPKYSYSYYNPTTGHASNRAPITEITEKNQVGRTVTISIAGAAANTTAYNAGYTQIIIYRTYAAGNQLVRINTTVANNNAGSAISFTESSTTYLDKFLTKDVAPLTTNKKPPTAFVALVAWLNRLFALRPSDPTNTPADAPRVYFSCLAGTVSEVPFGVGEESWPRLFSRGGIAQPKGLVVVGADGVRNSLVIQANDGDYSLDGYDNKTFTDPFLLATRRSGGFLLGALSVDGRLVQLYRDKRLFDAEEGDIGKPVQDKLNAINAAAITKSRLARFAYQSDNYLLVSYPKDASTTNSYTLVYDYDAARINEWTFGFTASTVVHNTATGALEMWTGDATGNVFKLLQAATWQDAGSNFAPSFKTAHLDFGRRKQIKHARIFVGPTGAEALTWQLTYYADEDTTGTTVNFAAAHTLYQSAQGRELLVEFEKPIFAATFQAKVTFPTANQDLYIERFELVFGDAQEDAEDS